MSGPRSASLGRRAPGSSRSRRARRACLRRRGSRWSICDRAPTRAPCLRPTLIGQEGDHPQQGPVHVRVRRGGDRSPRRPRVGRPLPREAARARDPRAAAARGAFGLNTTTPSWCTRVARDLRGGSNAIRPTERGGGKESPMHQIANRPAPDLGAVKARHQAMWAAGDCGRIGVQLQIVGERLCEAVDLGAADRVLDVAAGNGNASLAAAPHFADVTSTDYVPALLEQGRLRAEAFDRAVGPEGATVEPADRPGRARGPIRPARDASGAVAAPRTGDRAGPRDEPAGRARPGPSSTPLLLREGRSRVCTTGPSCTPGGPAGRPEIPKASPRRGRRPCRYPAAGRPPPRRGCARRRAGTAPAVPARRARLAAAGTGTVPSGSGSMTMSPGTRCRAPRSSSGARRSRASCDGLSRSKTGRFPAREAGRDRARVALPHWRGPRRTTAGKRRSFDSSRRS